MDDTSAQRLPWDYDPLLDRTYPDISIAHHMEIFRRLHTHGGPAMVEAYLARERQAARRRAQQEAQWELDRINAEERVWWEARYIAHCQYEAAQRDAFAQAFVTHDSTFAWSDEQERAFELEWSAFISEIVPPGQKNALKAVGLIALCMTLWVCWWMIAMAPPPL